jgi:HAE1 family hydrophobic/amphiphilic exporter-1
VISIVIVIAGMLARTRSRPRNIRKLRRLPSGYGHLSGADPKVVAETVATPIEEQVNGVEHALHVVAIDGGWHDDAHRHVQAGTDLDIAGPGANRVAIATPQLPQEVRNLGVTVQKQSPDLMMVVHLLSPDGTYTQAISATMPTCRFAIRFRDWMALAT